MHTTHPSSPAAPAADAVRIGVDVGGTNIRVCAYSATGVLLAGARNRSVKGADAVVDGISATVRQALEKLGNGTSTVAGVGIGIPGTVEQGTGIVRNAVNLGIADLDLAGRLSGKLGGVPVAVENDVNVAAVGACLFEGEGEDCLAYLNLGTGVAVGFSRGRHVLHGCFGMAGEIGHISVDPQGRQCACGQHGCLETMISGTALATLWPVDSGWPGTALFEAAAAGDAHAVAVRRAFCLHLFQAVQIIALSVDPAAIVIGGGVSLIGDPLLAGLRETIADAEHRSRFVRSLRLGSRVRLAPRGTDIACLGAAHLAVPFPSYGTADGSSLPDRPFRTDKEVAAL